MRWKVLHRGKGTPRRKTKKRRRAKEEEELHCCRRWWYVVEHCRWCRRCRYRWVGCPQCEWKWQEPDAIIEGYRFCVLAVGTDPSFIWKMLMLGIPAWVEMTLSEKPRADEFTMAHDQRIEQLTPGWSKPTSLLFPTCLSPNQPSNRRETSPGYSFLSMLIPDDELEDTKLADEKGRSGNWIWHLWPYRWDWQSALRWAFAGASRVLIWWRSWAEFAVSCSMLIWCWQTTHGSLVPLWSFANSW